MPRLPVPGGDDGHWGAILNDYLSVELTAEGALKRGPEIAALTGDGMKLADAVRKIAAQNSKKEGAVRASYYNYARKLDGTTSR